MNKKIVLPSLALLLLTFFITTGILQYHSQKTILSETVPVLPSITPKTTRVSQNTTTDKAVVLKPTEEVSPTQQAPEALSVEEVDKLQEFLPLHQSNYPTSVKIRTTINIFTTDKDIEPAIHVEVTGVDYNLPDPTGPNAIAFKESFIEARRQITSLGADIKKMRIVYGKYQSIQNQAVTWINTFKLLD